MIADNIEDGTQAGDLRDRLDINLMKNARTIVLNSDIDEYISGRLTRIFLYMSKENTEPITLLISSKGGEIDAGLAIIRAIEDARERGCSVIGEVRGYAMSMAAFILQHCDQRIASPEDIIMIHGATSVTIGDIRNQKADFDLTQRMMDNIAEYLSTRNTSIENQYRSKTYWSEQLQDNTPHYFFGREAYEKGLIDVVL